jgi:hypothetical protein
MNPAPHMHPALEIAIDMLINSSGHVASANS